MGQTRVTLEDFSEVRIKDNVASERGWHLWMSRYSAKGEFMADTSDTEIIVPDLDDATLRDAALAWAEGRIGPDGEVC